MTEDEYGQRLVTDGWPAAEVQNLVDDFEQGISFVVHEFVELADERGLTLHGERWFRVYRAEAVRCVHDFGVSRLRVAADVLGATPA